MKKINAIVAASALALVAGGANALTVAPDIFLGADTVLGGPGGSSPDEEANALEGILGPDAGDIYSIAKYSSTDGGQSPYFNLQRDDSGNWYFDLGDSDSPDYFVLKVGNLDAPDYTHFFYANIGSGDELGILAWSNNFSVCSTGGFAAVVDCSAAQGTLEAFTWATFLEEGGDGDKLSHITLFNGPPPSVIPLPAAGWLLLGGLGGLAALRRRKGA